MVGNEEEHEHEYVAGARTYQGPAGWRRTSWGAIFAGALVTLAVFLTLQILGAGIGASALDLTGSRVTSATSFGIGAAIWWFITGLIALFIGGWVAGRLSWRLDKLERALHGLTVWSLFYVAMFLLTLTALGTLVGGGVSLLSSGVSAAGQAATTPQGQQAMQQGAQSQGLSPQIIQQELAKILGGGRQGDPSVAAAVNDYLKSSRTQQDRQRAVQAITQATDMSEAQANQMLTNLERAGQEARETGEQAANITGGMLIGLSIAMLIGAIVAALGSLAAPAPPLVPARERETVTTTGGRTYTR
jgi:hypothetical protein